MKSISYTKGQNIVGGISGAILPTGLGVFLERQRFSYPSGFYASYANYAK